MDIDFAEVPAGRFLMGDDGGRADERPAHRVELGGFLAARVPVTNQQYGVFCAETGHVAPRFCTDPCFAGLDQPVVGVSWDDAIAYCGWFTARSGLLCRLPTEAEWEYAARGGLEGMPYPWGRQVAHVDGVSLSRAAQDRPWAVGRTLPNAYGLRDMGFNVHEWCRDWYAHDYYLRCEPTNPQGPCQGKRRASRGGAWRHQIKVSRCAARSSLPPDFHYNDYGFRVFADLPPV
jgi:formylglycine-generating enzyme